MTVPRYVPSPNGGMMQTQNGAYVSAADFDRATKEAESNKQILADAVESAAGLMKQIESNGLTAAEAEKTLRELIIAAQVAARMSRR